MLRPGALGRPREMGWGGRQEGGSGWGTLVNSWLIHVNAWQKPLQYCKVISLRLIKIVGEKNKNTVFNQQSKKQFLGLDFQKLSITSEISKCRNHFFWCSKER